MNKVLIADDVKSTRLILKRMLDKFTGNWDYQEASNGEEALDRYFASEPDVLLLDVQLPEANGWEILETIRQIDKKTRIIMITACEEPEDVLKAVRLGADGYVAKPFDQEELADALGLIPAGYLAATA